MPANPAIEIPLSNSVPAAPAEPSVKAGNISGGWYETRQDLQKEMQSEHDINVNQVFGGLSLRTALMSFLVMTLVVMVYEGTYIILYFVGVIPDNLLEAANTPGIPEEEREFFLDLESKQMPWLIAQLTWYCFGILFCFFGFFAFYMRSLKLFKIFQFWLFGHVFAYFATAIIFEQLSPVALEVPGYAVLTMFFALINVYAAHLSMVYKKRLVAIHAKEKAIANAPVIGEIESPV